MDKRSEIKLFVEVCSLQLNSKYIFSSYQMDRNSVLQDSVLDSKEDFLLPKTETMQNISWKLVDILYQNEAKNEQKYAVAKLQRFFCCLLLGFCKEYLSKGIISHKLQQKKIKLSMEVPYDDNFSDRYKVLL